LSNRERFVGLRRSLTPRERAALYAAQDGLCGCGCAAPLSDIEGVIAEHTIPVMLGNRDKPDSLWRKPCADAKTKLDLARIAKAKRQARETGQQARRARGTTKAIPAKRNPWPPKGARKIASRPFPRKPRIDTSETDD